jgi:hypothetical protein
MTTDTDTNADKEKLGQMLEQLHRFIRQRPGLEFGNYGDATEYRRELRGITRDKRDAEAMLFCVWRSLMVTKTLQEAAQQAFSGRLRWNSEMWEYDVGQYYCTEYRRAACAVLARALWLHWSSAWSATPFSAESVRAEAKRSLGVGIAKRWFN